MEYTKINALLQLLDDNVSNVYKAVENELKSVDISLLPVIEDAIIKTFGHAHRERFEEILEHLRFRQTEENINKWAGSENKSLLKGWYLASCLQYYDLEFETIETEVQKVVKDVWLEINDSLTSLEKTSIINHILFNLKEFGIDASASHEPRNFFVNHLLSEKKGNQLSIVILYHLIAKRLFLPIFPVNFNGHYLLGYYNPVVSTEAFGENASPFLFFINPDNKGAIISSKEMDYHLEKKNIKFDKSQILNTEISIIKHLLNNLQNAYAEKGQNNKAEQANKLSAQID
jgi:regulator of sirC expression with transglutaminase-like and TPR domain